MSSVKVGVSFSAGVEVFFVTGGAMISGDGFAAGLLGAVAGAAALEVDGASDKLGAGLCEFVSAASVPAESVPEERIPPGDGLAAVEELAVEDLSRGGDVGAEAAG
jgi:hypothetical protein